MERNQGYMRGHAYTCVMHATWCMVCGVHACRCDTADFDTRVYMRVVHVVYALPCTVPMTTIDRPCWDTTRYMLDMQIFVQRCVHD